MQNADWTTIKEIFAQTLDLPEAERERFLAEQNDFVRSEVSELLASHERAEDFIAEAALVEFGLDNKSLVGKNIGGYKLLELVGAGGMGTVFLAEKEDLGKRVALKIIKRGMDTDAVLRRFALEKKILARLEHTNIARLLDGGTTDEGLPFFVMEYVEGLPLTRFCDEHHFDTGERLQLFRQICSAVAYSHQNLIVHRDLKPSNIFITKDGTPKLLDFGIAKLLDSSEAENTATAARGGIFTPEYASPEHLSGQPITTASDVYSLGVILYELLTGARPFQTKSRNYDEIADLIFTQEPARPSSVVLRPSSFGETKQNKGQITGKGGLKTDPKSEIRNPKSLQGDLDNIILKSLRKEPERRYQSVPEFSEDIRRYLDGLPVSATTDSFFYRASKFLRRHRQGAVIGSVLGILIMLTSGAAIWQAIAANRERAKAERRFEQVRKLANTVLFEYHDGIAALPGATAMREKMVLDSLEFLDNLSNESGGNTDLEREIVKAYRKVGNIQGASDTGNVGKTRESLQSYQKAFAMQEKIAAENPKNSEDKKMLADLLIEIGLQQRSIGEIQNAEQSFTNALEILTNLPEDAKEQSALAKAFWNIASLQTAQNNLEASLKNYQKAVEIYEKLAAAEPFEKKHLRNVALTNKNIGSVLQLRGESEKALEHFQKSLAIDLENAKKNPNDVSAQLDLSFTHGTLGSVLRDLKDFESSLKNYRPAIEIREKIFNADPKNAFAENALARGFEELGRTFFVQKKYAEAERELVKAQAIYQKMADADAENAVKKTRLAENTALRGYVQGSDGNFFKASEFYEKSFEIYAELLQVGKLSPLEQRRLAAAYIGFGEILIKNKQPAKALENLQKADELLKNENVRKDASEEVKQLNKLLAEIR